VTRYQWCELAIASDVALPELRALTGPGGARVDWHVRTGRGTTPRRAGRRWFHHWRFPDGRRWLMFARQADGYLLRFPGMADFNIRIAGREIVCYRTPGTPSRTLRHLLLDQVLPLSAGSRQRLSLHASVVQVGSGAVGFLGAAGRGKSTIAASLAQRGCALVSDDCCLLRRSGLGFDVAPSYPGLRLSPGNVAKVFGGMAGRLDRVSHYSTKRRVVPEEAGVPFCDRPLPLRRLYVLAPLADLQRATRVTIARHSARERLLDLVAFTFHLDVRNARRIRDAFDLAGDVIDACEVRRLTVPWTLAGTEEVADAILSDVSLPD
jgi:hypothetical protein